uniref:Uncharacterized protein n=1 Tax=Cacopsylla melanoneura TaxID=428564 RepID=A0A8D8ULM5_9HEMI
MYLRSVLESRFLSELIKFMTTLGGILNVLTHLFTYIGTKQGWKKTCFFWKKNQDFLVSTRFFGFFYKLFSISWICHFNFGKKGYFSFPGNSTISFKIKMVYLLTKGVYITILNSCSLQCFYSRLSKKT